MLYFKIRTWYSYIYVAARQLAKITLAKSTHRLTVGRGSEIGGDVTQAGQARI